VRSLRQDSDTFSLTREFLSHMLGVRRNTVSVEAHAVQEAGLIRYSRGNIAILNRDDLEDCACFSASEKAVDLLSEGSWSSIRYTK
jgi:hypothetical protein